MDYSVLVELKHTKFHMWGVEHSLETKVTTW